MRFVTGFISSQKYDERTKRIFWKQDLHSCEAADKMGKPGAAGNSTSDGTVWTSCRIASCEDGYIHLV